MMRRFVLYQLDLKKLRAAEIQMWRGASRDTTARGSDLLNSLGNASRAARTQDVAPWSYNGECFLRDGIEYEASNFTAAGAVLSAAIKLPKFPFGIYLLSYTTNFKDLITFYSLWCIADAGDGVTPHVPFFIHAAVGYLDPKEVGRIEDYFTPLDPEDSESSLLEDAPAPSSLRQQRTIAAYRSVLEMSPEWAYSFALELINHDKEVDSEFVTMLLALPPDTSALVLALRNARKAKIVEDHGLALGRSLLQWVRLAVAIVVLLAVLTAWIAIR